MQRSKDADHDGRKLFLGGLPFECTEDDLRSDFGKFGEIEDLQFPNDGGRHKGFAFITYRDAADCSDASKEHHQRPYRVEVGVLQVWRAQAVGRRPRRRPLRRPRRRPVR